MKKYVDPTLKVTYFQNAKIVAEDYISFIAPLQDIIGGNPGIHERMESFTKILEFN